MRPRHLEAPRGGARFGERGQTTGPQTEGQQIPTYEAALEKVPIESGDAVLDIGCGTGAFLRLAADRGADALRHRRVGGPGRAGPSRVLEADVRVGEMEALPFEDDSFDLVTGFNSFFFATDIVAALREAGRVARPGAAIVIQVWGGTSAASSRR